MKQPSPFSLSVVFEGQTPYLNFVNTIKSAKTIKTYSNCLEGYIRYRRNKTITATTEGGFTLGNLLLENPRQIEASIK